MKSLVHMSPPLRCAFKSDQLKRGHAASVPTHAHGRGRLLLARCKRDESYEYSDPFNALVGRFLPQPKEEPSVDWSAEKKRGMTREQMAAMLEEGLNEREWFVTGRIDASLFSDEFSFQDDTVTIKGGNGLRRYALGVRQIFDQASSRAQVVGVRVLGDREILVKWRLEGAVNVGPFKLKIVPYMIDTTLTVDMEGLVVSQTDEFLVPGIQIVLGAILGAWAGPPPAPPIDILREKFKLS